MWGVIHNCVAHPLLGILGPRVWVVRFHDWTALRWARGTMNETWFR